MELTSEQTCPTHGTSPILIDNILSCYVCWKLEQDESK